MGITWTGALTHLVGRGEYFSSCGLSIKGIEYSASMRYVDCKPCLKTAHAEVQASINEVFGYTRKGKPFLPVRFQ